MGVLQQDGAAAGEERTSNGAEVVHGLDASSQVELPAALWQPTPVLPSELQSKLSEYSPLSPAAHGAHVTPRSGLHLLANDAADALSPVLDKLKPPCSLCDELNRQQKNARDVCHVATVHTAAVQGSWRLLDALAGPSGRILADIFVEASSGTRSKRKAVSVDHLFHQVCYSLFSLYHAARCKPKAWAGQEQVNGHGKPQTPLSGHL